MAFWPEVGGLVPTVCYRVEPKAVFGPMFLALTFGLFPYAVRYVLGEASRRRKLCVAVALGFSLQWAFALSEQRGIQAFQERLWETGHAEFLRLALRPLPGGWVRNYEQVATDGRWRYARTKPPGALMVYKTLAFAAMTPLGRGAELAVYGTATLDPLSHVRRRISALLFFVFPLLTFLALVPLYAFVRELWGEDAAWMALLLYPVTPSALLVTMHLDGALYPLVGCAALALVLKARQRPVYAVWGGAVLSLGVFVTFGLLALVPLAGALAFLGPALVFRGDSSGLPGAEPGKPPGASVGRGGAQACDPALPKAAGLKERLLRGLLLAALFVGGLLLIHALLWLVLGYKPISRYLDARAVHHAWKATIDLRPWLTRNLLQFAVWVGVPVMALALVQVVVGLRAGGWRTLTGIYGLLLVGVLLVTDLVGDLKSEVMRLWLFFVPLVCVLAAGRLVALDTKARPWLVWGVLIAQLVSVFALKSHLDCH